MARHQSGHFLLAIRFCSHLFIPPFFFDTCATVAIFPSYDSALCPARKKVGERGIFYEFRFFGISSGSGKEEHSLKVEKGEAQHRFLSFFCLALSLSLSFSRRRRQAFFVSSKCPVILPFPRAMMTAARARLIVEFRCTQNSGTFRKKN